MTTDQFILALTIWREARGESTEGRRAVLHVILNRARSKWGGAQSIPEVCLARLQFSSMTAVGDPMTVQFPLIKDTANWHAWADIAAIVSNDPGSDPTGGANHYYAVSMAAPNWADPSKFTVQIGNHKFYKL